MAAVQNVIVGRYTLVLRCKRGDAGGLTLNVIVTQHSLREQCTQSQVARIDRGPTWKHVRLCTVRVEWNAAIDVKLENTDSYWKSGLAVDHLQLVREA